MGILEHYSRRSSNDLHKMQFLIKVDLLKANAHLLITVNLFALACVSETVRPVHELLRGLYWKRFRGLWHLAAVILTQHNKLKAASLYLQHVLYLHRHYVWGVTWGEVYSVRDELVLILGAFLHLPATLTHKHGVLIYHHVPLCAFQGDWDLSETCPVQCAEKATQFVTRLLQRVYSDPGLVKIKFF